MFEVKSEKFDSLLNKYDFKLCAEYVFILAELGDPFILNCLLFYTQDRITFLKNKIKWIKEFSRDDSSEFEYMLHILVQLKNDLSTKICKLENNKVAANLGCQLKKYWNDNNLDAEYLKEKSYFSVEELIKIEQGDYKVLDTCDINHLLSISKVNSLEELSNYGNSI